MKKILFLCFTLFSITNGSLCLADTTGLYIGGGAGYGIQDLSLLKANTTQQSPALRGFIGYQFASWIDVEAGYTYISQSTNWNNLGNPSVTIYDLAFMPGFTLPLSPVTIYTRLGVDTISANLNSGWYNQIVSTYMNDFEWGLGVKIELPETRTFIRAEYINYGTAVNNSNNNLSVSPSVIMLNAGYIF